MVALQAPSYWRGLNRAVHPTLLSEGESPDTTDARSFGKLIGALGPRLGRNRVYTHTAAYTILGIGQLRVPWGNFRGIFSSDGKWSMKGLAWPGFATPADLADLTGMDTAARVRSVQFKERMYAFNGANLMRCCDGNVWTLAGIAKITPTTSYIPTATLGSTGLTGKYRYFVTPCNSKKLNPNGRALEGVPSNISAEVAPAAQAVTINNIPATHPDSQVDSFNVYRNKDGTYDTGLTNDQQDFFLVGSVPLGTTSFVDTVSDTTLTNRPLLRFDQNTPPAFRFGAVYNNRLYGAGFDPIHAGTVTRAKTISLRGVATNVAAFTTSTAHGFTSGQSVTIAGMTGGDAFYNGTYTLTATGATTFTVPLVHADDANDGPTGTATAVSASIYLDFTTALPEGALGAWFKKDGESQMYRIIAISGTRATIAGVVAPGSTDVGFTSALSASTYTVFRKPWEIYISEFNDVEAWGPDGEGLRNKIDLPGHQAATGMIVFQDTLLVFTANSIYAIYGQGQTIFDIGIRKVFNGIGAVSADAICAVDNEIHFLSKRGPAVLAGGEPQLIGVPLNTDWIDSLTADEFAIATLGSDDENVWVSVPAHGQTENSRTFRYERYTQTWWEETESCPSMYVRVDLANGVLNALVYTQGRFIIQPNSGTLDIVSAAVSGAAYYTQTGITSLLPQRLIFSTQLTGNVATIVMTAAHGFQVGDSIGVNASDSNYNGTFTVVSVPSATSLTYALVHANIGLATYAVDTAYGVNLEHQFTTTGAALQQCYIRFYHSNGVLFATRRITSNAIYLVTWVNDGTVGSGTVDVVAGDTWEIGNVGWKWRTKEHDGDAAAQNKKADSLVMILAQLDASAHIYKNDIIDGAEDTTNAPLKVDTKKLATKFEVNRANYTYAARLQSRDGAVLRSAVLIENTDPNV